MFPLPVQGFAGPIASQLPITPFNLVCTNIPGPQVPLYLLGHKMLDWYPYVPIGGEMAVNCAILSYNGMVYFGFSGDVKAAPDLRRLEKMLKESFAELRDEVLLESARHEARKKKQPKPVRSANEPKASASGRARTNGSALAHDQPTDISPKPEPENVPSVVAS